MQDTKQNSPKIIPDRAGGMVEGASTSKEEAVQVTNVSDSQTQAAALGELPVLMAGYIFCCASLA